VLDERSYKPASLKNTYKHAPIRSIYRYHGREKMSGTEPSFRINSLEIHNYRGIKELTLDFFHPRMAYDPDIMVIGSKNGLGKTSILECCAILMLLLDEEKGSYFIDRRKIHSSINIPDLLIRSGSDEARISGEIEYHSQRDNPEHAENIGITVSINRDETIHIQKTPFQYDLNRWTDGEISEKTSNKNLKSNVQMDLFLRNEGLNNEFYHFLNIISGTDENPLIIDTCLFFHSFRKVLEGKPQLGDMVGDDTPRTVRMRNQPSRISSFKLTVLRMMMGQADLFESGSSTPEDARAMDVLNTLMETYAGATFSKLRPSQDNSIDIRIKPVQYDTERDTERETNEPETYSFDGLSSGQKEIISTLFTIWNATCTTPSVVLIDEPEMHLNAEWHRTFIKNLLELAPENQYIISTHSEEVMDSVATENRILLLPGNEE
jgi:predicted ATP-dependent endonuclease of OLD family